VFLQDSYVVIRNVPERAFHHSVFSLNSPKIVVSDKCVLCNVTFQSHQWGEHSVSTWELRPQRSLPTPITESQNHRIDYSVIL